MQFGLESVKPMYGLNDAPLAFEVAQEMFFINDLEGTRSGSGECFYFWLEAMNTSHIDDNGNAGSSEWLTAKFKNFSNGFGGTTRSKLP